MRTIKADKTDLRVLMAMIAENSVSTKRLDQRSASAFAIAANATDALADVTTDGR